MDQAVHQKLTAVGVSAADVEKLKAVGSINWGALLQAIAQYGPQIVAVILAILGGGTPAPTPGPTPAQ